MNIYSLSNDLLEEIKKEYAKELRENPEYKDLKPLDRAKKISKLTNEFFKAETKENKEWLTSKGYLTEEATNKTEEAENETDENKSEKTNNFYGFSDDVIAEIRSKYSKELRESPEYKDLKPLDRAKKISKLTNEFFKAETKENKEWLTREGYLTESSVSISFSIPYQKIINIFNIVDKLDAAFEELYGMLKV